MAPHMGILRKSRRIAKKSRRELVSKTLEEDYPGLDYLGFHNVLVAKKRWYCIGWFLLLFICLFGGLFTVVKVIEEYSNHPTVTRVEVKSVESLPLPYVTICPTGPTTVNLTKLREYVFRNFNIAANFSIIDFAKFMIAGSGFQKIDIESLEKLNETIDFYREIRGNLSTKEFFDFFFDNFGLECEEIFVSCSLRSHSMDCCQIFTPTYTIRRGRCFRLKEALLQTTFDEQGKLTIYLKRYHEFMDPTGEKELIAYIGDEKPEIAPFPRFYLYQNTYMRLQLKATHMDLVEEGESVCTDEYSSMGKSTCYLNSWLKNYLEDVHNCTYPYMDRLRDSGLPSCDPVVVVENYNDTVQNIHYHKHKCILACNRWEYSVAMERVIVQNPLAPFRVDIFYNDLQYEEFTGFYSTTFFGLLAQIGGQLSLFLGSSILSLVQLTILLVVVGKRVARHDRVQTREISYEMSQAGIPDHF